MEHEIVERGEIQIVGIQTRTNNQLESNPATARIPGLWQRFYAERVAERIPNRVNPDTIYEAYVEYESDHTGDYTVVLGVEVPSFDTVPADFVGVRVPRSKYLVTPTTGNMPRAVQQAWVRIWQHFDAQKQQQRAYRVDFEQYRVNEHGEVARCDVFVSLR
jgi:predicted transcriptional regulator YdeE